MSFFDSIRTIIRAGWHFLSRNIGDLAMKASSILFVGLAVSIISIAPANAQNARKPPSALAQPTAPAEDRWKALTTYADCKKLVVELGWSDWEGWYGCNSRNFKK